LPLWNLAELAECEHPGPATPGAAMLLAVRDAMADMPDDESDPERYAHEAADSAVPVYTRDLWAAVVGLAAYSELNGDAADSIAHAIASGRGHDLPALLLYPIAERLALALLDL
jgi:hypothetical protein